MSFVEIIKPILKGRIPPPRLIPDKHLDAIAGYRFSPGYCDWGLEEQALIFKVLDASSIGVSLSPHFVMSPAKSVSAIAAVADEVPFPAPRAFCRRDCPHRRLERSGQPFFLKPA